MTREGYRYVEQHFGSDLIISMLKFTLEKVEKGNVESVLETVTHIVTEQTRGDVMTLAKQLEERGMQQGMQQGMLRGKQEGVYLVAKNLINENIPLDVIAKVTNLTINELRQVIKN